MLSKFIYKKRFILLFFALLLPYFLHPLATQELWGLTLLDFTFSLVLIIGIFAVSHRRHLAVTALGMVLLVQVLTWTTRIVSSHVLILTGITLNTLYLIYTVSILLIYLLRSQSVSSETIFASLCVYLLIGYIWAFFYSFVDDISPNSFQINKTLFTDLPHGHHIFSKVYYFLYFSFTNLTTLSFGDIMPASSWTRVLASTEAMVGQLYLVVLVSRLVGIHISQSMEGKKKS
jgi:hypothetical protein